MSLCCVYEKPECHENEKLLNSRRLFFTIHLIYPILHNRRQSSTPFRAFSLKSLAQSAPTLKIKPAMPPVGSNTATTLTMSSFSGENWRLLRPSWGTRVWQLLQFVIVQMQYLPQGYTFSSTHSQGMRRHGYVSSLRYLIKKSRVLSIPNQIQSQGGNLQGNSRPPKCPHLSIPPVRHPWRKRRAKVASRFGHWLNLFCLPFS